MLVCWSKVDAEHVQTFLSFALGVRRGFDHVEWGLTKSDRSPRRGPARGQAGARFEHAAFDRGRNSASDLLGERRLGGAVDVQVQGLRHAAVVHYSFAFLVLFPAQQKAIFRVAEGESP